MSTRFSKAALITRLSALKSALERKHKFNPHDGWDQVDCKGEEINRQYGRYVAITELLDEIS